MYVLAISILWSGDSAKRKRGKAWLGLSGGGGLGGRGRLAASPPCTPTETGPAPITKQQIIAALNECYALCVHSARSWMATCVFPYIVITHGSWQ